MLRSILTNSLPAASILDRLAELGDQAPERTAFVVARPDGIADQLTYGELTAWSAAMSRTFTIDGLGPDDVLVIAVRNHIAYLSLAFGAWLAAVPVLLISPNLGIDQRDALLDLVAADLGRPVLAAMSAVRCRARRIWSVPRSSAVP
jgi:acyl-CoA synthetase (AMP-forming)/AMP-acid ligase II